MQIALTKTESKMSFSATYFPKKETMIDRRIKFRHIQCFVEIAQSGSFKRAAETLFLTQPAISKTLKELEDILGCNLMERSRAGVSLTTDGARFLQYAQMALASLQQGLQDLGNDKDTQTETLAIGALPSVTAKLLPAVSKRLSQDPHPFTLRILDGPHKFLLDKLVTGEIDMLLGRMGDHRDMVGLNFSLLYREKISFIVRKGHPLLKDASLEGLKDWPIIYPDRNAAIRPSVDRFMVERGISDLYRRVETVSGAFGRRYVAESDAIWIISDGVAASEVDAGRLERLPFDTDTTLGPIGIVTREDWDLSHPARIFRRALRETVEDLDL